MKSFSRLARQRISVGATRVYFELHDEGWKWNAPFYGLADRHHYTDPQWAVDAANHALRRLDYHKITLAPQKD